MGTGGEWEAGWGDGPPGDVALIAAVAERRHEALAEVYRRHGGAVWAVAQRVCRSQAPAEDVCEAVFAELWERPELFEPARGTLRARLIAVAHARAVAVVRASGPVPVAVPEPARAHLEALDPNARRAMDQLEPGERDALLLCYIGGRPCREAAGLLGVTETEIKSNVRTGLVNLRRALDAEGVSR